MARLVLTNAYITINAVNLSDHIASVTLTTNDDVVETTAFGSTARTRVAGLGDNSVAIEFHQDYAAANVEATVYPLLGTTTAVGRGMSPSRRLRLARSCHARSDPGVPRLSGRLFFGCHASGQLCANIGVSREA